jgi:DNA-binding response OmpR family regulator
MPVHVLVADDEPHIGRIIKMKLEQGPFRVTLAYDGREAIDVLERESDIKLVLLDLMMPRLTGLDVLAVMRKDARWLDLPCVILTAAGEEQQYHKAISMGASDFMTKPFSPKKLFNRSLQLAGLAPLEAPVEAPAEFGGQ